MKKVLIAYFSLTGTTQRMAEYIAEGVRISGQQATLKKLKDLKTAEELNGYDGYLFGSPTYNLTMAEPMKTFLFMAKKADLAGKPAGAFGSYTHDGVAAKMILDTMEHVFKMEPFELGALKLTDDMLGAPGTVESPQLVAGTVHAGEDEGLRACQDYGRVFGEKLG